MVDFFIHRPVFSTVCALMIILAGAVCIPTLPIAQFPNLAPPQVGVSAVYTGASAQTVESAVTTVLEQQINGAEGMKYITSSSGNDGSSSITATFDITRDPDLASVDIQNRVNTAQGRLPNAVKQVGVVVAKTSQNFVFGAGGVGVHTDVSRRDVGVDAFQSPRDVGVDADAPIWLTATRAPAGVAGSYDGNCAHFSNPGNRTIRVQSAPCPGKPRRRADPLAEGVSNR